MKKIQCLFGKHKYEVSIDSSCKRKEHCIYCGKLNNYYTVHNWGEWSNFDGCNPPHRQCKHCGKIEADGPEWRNVPKDPKGRLIIGKTPFKELEDCSYPGESSWRSVKKEQISIIEETEEYRKIFVKMTVADGHGVTNYDPSGSWGGASEGPPYEVEYTALEKKQSKG